MFFWVVLKQIQTGHFLLTPALRLTLWIAVHMHENAMACMGPDCSSWGLPARGSSMRSYINWHGNVFSTWVRRSTTMISRLLVCNIKYYAVHDKIKIYRSYHSMVVPPRMVLLILVLMANNCVWMVEQPRQSLLALHMRFSWLMTNVAWVPTLHLIDQLHYCHFLEKRIDQRI